MVVGEASIHNIMGGMESTGGVRLHNHKRKLKQRFDIIKKLGQGTYGKVQLGINKETGQEVAIKTIKKCKIETEADLIRIRREIQIMSSVQHPNIIHIYEVFENREKMVLVMEYAAGGELYDYLSERKVLTEQEARRIFRQIATAVFYCHKHKICHRDLKLENILLDQLGNAKIADFGLSNVFDEQRLLNTFCGSPLYASPEIVKGTPYHGPEVDCWSLGVLLYTLVYGAMPFDGSNFKRLVKQISQSDYFEPKKPSPASPLIKDMLTVCPARRADIERICTHWWVNEDYDQSCLEIAEELAAQTPVRLDLLLSLVPREASAEKLLVGDHHPPADGPNDVSSETIAPTRCHSVGSLMELDQKNSDRRIREMFEEEPRSGEAKRKLETTPSMDETAAAGVKRKERSRRKERTEEREPRAYKSASRHHSAPIPNAITEEAMEIEPTVSVPTSKTADLAKIEAAACLELIQECKERSPSKERSKTPTVPQERPTKDVPMETVEKEREAVPEDTSRSDDQKLQDFEESHPRSSAESTGPVEASNESNSAQKREVSKAEDVPKESTVCATEKAESSTSRDAISTTNVEVTQRESKKLKEKALSLDSELSAEVPPKTYERRRSKIFETAEKLNQLASTTLETEKPKKIFIPGVNVGGAKRVFERKASLSSIATPPVAKPSASKVIIDVPTEKKPEQSQSGTELEEKPSKRDEAKKRAVDIISGAIGKPPAVQRKVNGSPVTSPPISPPSHDPKKLPIKIPLAPNDLRSATVSVSTPTQTKFPFDGKVADQEKEEKQSQPDEPKMSSKMEITLKSATLPRPRKTSKAEISLSGVKSSEPIAFKSELEARIDAFQPQRLRTQRSEIAFPVGVATPQANRSSSLEPEGRPRTQTPKERIIPIQVEAGHQPSQHSSTPPPRPPLGQRSVSQRSGSLSRQSTADSDTDSALGSTLGPEPIRKSPREYIIPIAVEGGGYVTPRSGSVEPEGKTGTPSSSSRTRFGRPRRMSSLLSDASEDESPFSSLHRDSEDLLHRHMHRLRSSRPSRQTSEHADSLSSGEDDDDDGFELLTAENLFSTLLSRVRSLTQRLNVDDNRGPGFPSSRLFGRLGANSPQAFWGINKPLSRRLTESQLKHSLGRESDPFSRKDSANSSNSANSANSSAAPTPSSPDREENVFNTLPRDKVEDSLEQSFTPSLARRLSRQLLEQSRRSLPRSLSVPYESLDSPEKSLDRTLDRSLDRGVRRSNSLLENYRRSPRRSVSLFEEENEDGLLSPFRRQMMTLGRKYKERDSFQPYRNEKIQEEEDAMNLARENLGESNLENGSTSECTSTSVCNSATNLLETTSSVSKSYETSPTESSSNVMDYKSAYKSDSSRNFEDRLLAAENLIKESKLRNLGPSRFNPNLSSSYKDTDKCDKESLDAISESSGSILTKRRSCIPSLRLRSGSLSRDPVSSTESRRKSFTGSQDVLGSPEKSLLSKFFRGGSTRDTEKTQKPKQHRISRFLRPDFFDTPREESKYVKEKEAQKAAENERRKSRFTRRKTEGGTNSSDERREKELKNEINSLKKDRSESDDRTSLSVVGESLSQNLSENLSQDLSQSESQSEKQGTRSSFLHSLEKKLEKLRSNDESAKPVANGGLPTDEKTQNLRENSAPPSESTSTESKGIKKAISVEDLSPRKTSQSSSRSRVSSVLGLFKNTEAKQGNGGGGRSQSTILSRLKKSPPKSTKSNEAVPTEDSPSTSRIPTKSSKPEPKLSKKSSESKKPSERTTEQKKSPPKEKPREKEIAKEQGKIDPKHVKENGKEKKIASEKSTKLPDKSPQQETDATLTKPKIEKTEAPTKVENGKPPEASQTEEKKLLKTKKNTSLVKSSSTADEAEKKVRKVVKSKETGEKDETELTKRKKIVRVVRKVVKKSSDSSESKTEEKPKPAKLQVKKKLLSKTDKCGESSNETESSAKLGSSLESSERVERVAQEEIDTNPNGNASTSNARKASEPKLEEPAEEQTNMKSKTSASTVSAGIPSQLQPLESSTACLTKSNVESRIEEAVESPTSANECKNSSTIGKPKPGEEATSNVQQRNSRAGLKLDLSKIPQHSFRGTSSKSHSPKSDSPKPSVQNESPRSNTEDKLLDCLSRITHHANIAGSKIIIDKPLRARDVAELRKEVTECAKIIESSVPKSENLEDPVSKDEDESLMEEESRKEEPVSLKESSDYTNDLFSPTDEPESFDSWSLSSVDLNNARPDLHSPTSPSPSHGLFSRGDQSESVIDRIRRRSFYSRFNDRRRPSLTAPPPGVSLPSSATLPRKFSFGGARERDRRKLSGYETPKSRDRGYDCYEETLSPKASRSYGSAKGRDRGYDSYEDSLPARRTPYISDQYSSLSSSYDPLRRYLRSPSFDLPSSRLRYHSADLPTDRTPLSSLLNESVVESHAGSSVTLPRRYASTAEPKTVEYYEELLAPTNTEYLTSRKSPMLRSRCENGYHNGGYDVELGGRRKSYADRIPGLEMPEGNDGDLGGQRRNRSERLSEARSLPSTSTEPPDTCTAD